MTIRIWMDESMDDPITHRNVGYIAQGPSLLQVFDRDHKVMGTYEREYIAMMTVNA